MSPRKYVYSFGGGKADGRGEMKNLLGGKGANLCEMSSLGVPVPSGFTVTTDVCTHYYANRRKYPAELKGQVERAIKKIEREMGTKFGDLKRPLLLSVRSGARMSMPGMMETVLNIGLTEATLPGLIAMTGNERFAYDSYRRLITMYSDVVMEKSAGIEPREGKGIRPQLERLLEAMKRRRKVTEDGDLTAEDLKDLCAQYKAKVKKVLGSAFPDDPNKQLWGGLGAVFASWMGKRAIAYRRIEGIPAEWGTAVNVQAMVFGNMGPSSSTGVAFSRNPATGENVFFGEYLVNAQGEDVVAGTRTPLPLNIACKTEMTRDKVSLEESEPKLYKQLDAIQKRLEKHYRDMQDIEFTIQEGRLWMLQCRIGKRTGRAAIRMAVEMVAKRMISKEEAVARVKPEQLDELLHPMIDPEAEKTASVLGKGLPAGPGGATGQIVFTPDLAEQWAIKEGRQVILVRHETSPEDVHGMHVAEAILTSKGGMTSHAALVARGWGKCCIVGCAEAQIDYKARTLTIGGKTLREGDSITMNGSAGTIYAGTLPLVEVNLDDDKPFQQLMKWADAIRTMKVRTNCETTEDARKAIAFGAEGVGLCRTEHMFFGEDRIRSIRKMIVAENEKARRRAVMELLPHQRKDFMGILKAMAGKPVTIRLLDPPLHEFVPHEKRLVEDLAHELGITAKELSVRISALHELNPMLGHRGCRLGITYPEITEMQARAIFEAAASLTKKKIKVYPEVMIPLVGTKAEYDHQAAIIKRVAGEVRKKTGVRFPFMIGTMIEIPRAALVADKIAEGAEFFSFGTNDLTQMTFGYSRDDIGSFLPHYLDSDILPEDPFASLDETGVGELVRIGVERGRATRPNLKIGICGEHGGDPASVDFCHRVGLDYVSCSPFRVPIARLAAAHAELNNPRKPAKKKAGRKKPAKKKKARKRK